MLLTPELSFYTTEVEVNVTKYSKDCNLQLAFLKWSDISKSKYKQEYNLNITESKAFLSEDNFSDYSYALLSMGVCAFFPFALSKLNEKWKNIALDLILKGVKDSKTNLTPIELIIKKGVGRQVETLEYVERFVFENEEKFENYSEEQVEKLKETLDSFQEKENSKVVVTPNTQENLRKTQIQQE